MASASYNVSRAFPEALRQQNQPDNTAFTQQRLPAWQPLLSAGTVLPLFFGLGLAFLAIGLGLYFTSAGIQEVELDYTGGRSAPTNCTAGQAANLTAGPRHAVPAGASGLALPAHRLPTARLPLLPALLPEQRRYNVTTAV
ncbi:putative Cell cycle control protein [Naja naja]|nr:putative Cell cycle control protein [Naja naja]